jgi:4'-phosphopantetheinyl transferase
MILSPRQRLAVPAWPQVLTVPVPANGLMVFQVATDGDHAHDRTSARAQVRLAVLQVLEVALALAPDQIVLTSTPGQPPRLVLAGYRAAGLSISHEAGLSLAAINLHGGVGVDLMRAPQQDEPADLIGVARDYLGPAAALALADVALHLRPIAFAKAWTAHEAGLKCGGLALAEWRPAPPSAPLRIAELQLPAPYIGAVATPA